MAEDRKFFWDEGLKCFRNRVNGAAIPDDEPVFLMRARDIHAVPTLEAYFAMIPLESTSTHHREAVYDRVLEFRAFRDAQIERMKEPGITKDIVLNRELFNTLSDMIYEEPTKLQDRLQTLWESMDSKQQKFILDGAKARGDQIPEWMKIHRVEEGPVLIVDGKGVYPENLDRAVADQIGIRSVCMYAKGYGPADGDEYIIDGFIKNARITNDICYGEIYSDQKNRFKDGDNIHTSKILSRVGNIIRTRNSVYEIEEYKPKS